MNPSRAFARNARFFLLVTSFGACVSWTACGIDVNLGGTSDGGAAEAGVVNLCEPCAASPNCPVGAACAKVSGNLLFCATLCPQGTECDVNALCQLLPGAGPSESVRVCAPKLGACDPAKSPTNDGAPLDRCGSLVGPGVVATCSSCDKFDRDCQKNGCYGGWWCNTSRRRCEKPPASCP